MVRRTKADTEITRQGILDAASHVFVDKGVAKATLEQIARAAGVTRGAIYWHFKNKQDLFQALYDQFYTSFIESVLKDLENDHPAPLTQLQQLCVALFQDLSSNIDKQRVLSLFMLRCDYSGELASILECQNKRKLRSLEVFSEYFKRAQQRGHLAEQACPHTLTLSLQCYLSGMAYEYLRNPNAYDLASNAEPMLNLFFAGVSQEK